MNRIRGSMVRLGILLAGGRCGPGLRVERGLRVRQRLHAGIRLGRDVYLGQNTTLDCPVGGICEVGDYVTLTQGVFISALSSVRIGHDVLIGEYSSIRDSNHRIDAVNQPVWAQGMESGPLSIGNDVWVGRGVAVLAGAEVAEGAVIGANSVVSHAIPRRAIAVGSPARVIRYRPEAG